MLYGRYWDSYGDTCVHLKHSFNEIEPTVRTYERMFTEAEHSLPLQCRTLYSLNSAGLPAETSYLLAPWGLGRGGGGGWGHGSSGLELLGSGREGMWNHRGGGLKPYGRDLEPRVCGLESYE